MVDCWPDLVGFWYAHIVYPLLRITNCKVLCEGCSEGCVVDRWGGAVSRPVHHSEAQIALALWWCLEWWGSRVTSSRGLGFAAVTAWV